MFCRDGLIHHNLLMNAVLDFQLVSHYHLHGHSLYHYHYLAYRQHHPIIFDVFNTFKIWKIFFSKKICLIRHRCKAIGLLNEIDSLLNYLIENNMNYFTGLNKRISPDFKWPNNEIPNRNKLDLIHDLECPGKKSENDMTCERLDKDPIFRNF